MQAHQLFQKGDNRGFGNQEVIGCYGLGQQMVQLAKFPIQRRMMQHRRSKTEISQAEIPRQLLQPVMGQGHYQGTIALLFAALTIMAAVGIQGRQPMGSQVQVWPR